jgi:(S)-2-hydroxyglutarate dehydrogenase
VLCEAEEEPVRYDVVVVGGGIVGLSTAMAVSTSLPGSKVVVLEKETEWAHHQTGHNSGVIHSGIYYKPGSLKAVYAREGAQAVVAFCREHGIAHEVTGKIIVATEPEELPLLERLHERGQRNGLTVKRLAAEELAEHEPHVAGLAGVHVASTGIVDFKAVARAYAELAAKAGAELRLGTRVEGVAERADAVTVETTAGPVAGRLLVNCAGLQCDRIARLAGVDLPARIVPFRGEYYELVPERRHLVRNLIYPVPDPAFPFLGVHFTRGIDGSVHAGPNAVLSLKREGYTKASFSARDLAEVLGYPAFWRLARANWRQGVQEIRRSLSKRAFVRSLQRLVPEVRAEDLTPTHAGVRAQAILPDGKLVDDFLIVSGPRSVHVLNAPSPAATASLPIGAAIAEQVRERVTA